MKFNLENSRKWIKNTVLGTVATVGMVAPAFANEKKEVVLDKNKIEVTTPETTPETNAEVINFAAEQQMALKIKALEKKKSALELEIQHLSGQLQSEQVDFSNNYQSAISFTGDKAKAAGFEMKLADLVKKYAEERVGKQDITSPAAVNSILGILLSMNNSPLKKESAQLTSLAQGQLGSTVMMGTGKPGKYESPDMSIHKHLGVDPKLIAETMLNIVQKSHDLEQVTAELNDLLDIPTPVVAQN